MNKHTEVEEIVEWRDGVIVEFSAYGCSTTEGGMENYDQYLSIFQRGIVLGDEVVGCDYELSKDDFVDGVYKEGVDENGCYNVEEYLEANLIEPEWYEQVLQDRDRIAREEEREKLLRLAKHHSSSAYFVHGGQDYITLANLEKALTTPLEDKE